MATKSSPQRLSVCFVVPEHDLLPSWTISRHLRGLARLMSERADVTVAFRRVPQSPMGEGFSVLELEPRAEGLGDGLRRISASIRAVDGFAEEHLRDFDVVLESSWVLSGRVSSWCGQHGIPAVPIITHVPVLDPLWAAPVKASRTWLTRGISGQYLRRAQVIVAESALLKSDVMRSWKVPAERIEVIEPGVDRSLFRPQDQAGARERLGVAGDQKILVYVGALDRARDLTPVIEAVDRVCDPRLQLHILGDGPGRAQYERAARPGGPVTFHGRVSTEQVAAWIAAADLCLALDDRRASPERRDGYSTLAVRESLASGRPVAFAAHGGSHELIRHLVNGFLLENHLLPWIQFLQRECPSRGTLRIMGGAAAAVPVSSLEDAAQAYLGLCRRIGESRASAGTG